MITEEMIEELKKAFNEKSKELNAARIALFNAKDLFAQQNCQHKVGDVIDCGGYSHQGKKMVVDRIERPDWSGYDWRVCGRPLKKDGSIGSAFYAFNGSKE
jgi:hypothetical protein